MNLIDNTIRNRINKQIDKIDNGILTIDDFRESQYKKLSYFCELMIKYLSRQNNDYLEFVSCEIKKRLNYVGLYNSQLSEVKITIKNNEEKIFLQFLIPTLIDGSLFFMNGNYYIPTMYIIDYPIVIKNKSLKISSLFNSITFYMKNDIVIFTGVNIPMSIFIQLFLSDENKKNYAKIIERHKLKHQFNSETEIINYFENRFQFGVKTKKDLITKLENLFLDDFTLQLYKETYFNNDNISLTKIVNTAIKMYSEIDEIPSFVDLTQKRIVFIEMLLSPIIKRIATITKQVWRGIKYDKLNLDQLVLLKYFLASKNPDMKIDGLSGNFLYSTTNLYSALLKNKISMVPPGVEDAPRSVQTIHPTHYGRICPISISSQNAGHIVSILSGTKINELGLFHFD